MEDEFTTDMHEEFTVPEETEISHRVYSVLTVVKMNIFTLDKALDIYKVTMEQYLKYKDKWQR